MQTDVRTIEFEDLGLKDYQESWDYQQALFDIRVMAKLENRNLPISEKKHLNDVLLFVEHPHVYTLGKSGKTNNILITKEFMELINATYYHIDRGGDITYHGPGQIVGYPIFDLEHFGLHIKQYVFGLEESIILTLAKFGISAGRIEGATGVWIDNNSIIPRKICAIGVKASRHITMHGFAFNVNTDLNYFSHINPCGFVDKGVTSLEKELGLKQDMNAVKAVLQETIIKYFSSIGKA